MPRTLIPALAGAALAILGGCGHENVTLVSPSDAIVGSGVTASEMRPVSGFTAITVTGPLRLVLQQAGSESLEVTADDNVLRLVQSDVHGGRLFLGLAPGTSLTRAREIVCRVTTSLVIDVEASGAARLEMSDVRGTRLGVRLSGAVQGAASGAVDDLALDVSGASRWTAASLSSRVVTAGISGASYALVRARDTLVANVSGASTLEYLGDPGVTATVDTVSTLRRVGP